MLVTSPVSTRVKLISPVLSLRLEDILQKQEESEPVREDTDLASLSQKLPTEDEMIPVLKFLDESTPK